MRIGRLAFARRHRTRPRVPVFSRRMIVAADAVFFLAERPTRRATVAALACGIRHPRPEVEDALERLAEKGIVAGNREDEVIVSLSEGLEQLCMADVADAVGDWLAIAEAGPSEPPSPGGAKDTFARVEARILNDLRTLRVIDLLCLARPSA